MHVQPVIPARWANDPLNIQMLRHDAFRASALGDAGWMVLRWLEADEPIRGSHLAAALGMNADRVRKTLGLLQSASIARRVPDGWVRAPEADLIVLLDLVALEAGTHGALDLDRARYETERALYRGGSAVIDETAASEVLDARARSEIVGWWTTWWGSLAGARDERAA